MIVHEFPFHRIYLLLNRFFSDDEQLKHKGNSPPLTLARVQLFINTVSFRIIESIMDAHRVNLKANEWALATVCQPNFNTERDPNFIRSRAAANQRLAYSLSQIYHRPNRFLDQPPPSSLIERHHVVRARKRQEKLRKQTSHHTGLVNHCPMNADVTTLNNERYGICDSTPTFTDRTYSNYPPEHQPSERISSRESRIVHSTSQSRRHPSEAWSRTVPAPGNHPLITSRKHPYPQLTPMPRLAIFTDVYRAKLDEQSPESSDYAYHKSAR